MKLPSVAGIESCPHETPHLQELKTPPAPYLREYTYPIVFCIVLLVLVEIPYVLGYSAPTTISAFNGFLSFEGDFNSYMSYIRQSKEGQWLFDNQFTPEPHRPVFFNLGWLLTGKMAALTGISIERSYRITGAILVFLWSICLYRLCTLVFFSRTTRRLVFSMVAVGGGFGWIAYLHEQWIRIPVVGSAVGRLAPYDMRAFLHPFFSILFSPHVAGAEAFVLLTLCLFLRAERTGRLIDYILASLACLTLGAMRPFDLLYMMATATLYVVFMAISKSHWSWPLAGRRLLITIIPLPLMAYYAWLFTLHPVYRWWGVQNIIPPPPISALFVSMGLLAILFIFSLDKLGGFNRRPDPQVLLASCFIAGSLIVFVTNPIVKSSGQLFSPFIVPVALLAIVDLELPIISLARRKAWGIPTIIAVLTANSLSSVFLYARTIAAVTHHREVIPALGEHRTATSLLEAYRWLEQNSRPREVVLASLSNCNRIPHYTRNATFAGYVFNTVNFAEKRKFLDEFLNKDTSEVYRRDLLRRYGVRFVLWGPEERALSAYQPERSALFAQRFTNDTVTIYEFVSAAEVDRR